jgi:hypothetical protein
VKHVPTAAELVKMGLAELITVKTGAKMTSQMYRISTEGMALMRDAMKENALEAIARGETAWVEPPSRPTPWKTGT